MTSIYLSKMLAASRNLTWGESYLKSVINQNFKSLCLEMSLLVKSLLSHEYKYPCGIPQVTMF